jgi:hypothetical protein
MIGGDAFAGSALMIQASPKRRRRGSWCGAGIESMGERLQRTIDVLGIEEVVT